MGTTCSCETSKTEFDCSNEPLSLKDQIKAASYPKNYERKSSGMTSDATKDCIDPKSDQQCLMIDLHKI